MDSGAEVNLEDGIKKLNETALACSSRNATFAFSTKNRDIMLSSATLFHFVPNLDYLLNNIEEGFFPYYCEDRVPSFGVFEKLVIPMTCFCDIPLSSIVRHTDTYGRYGIGVTKDWAMKHGISPIIYSYPEAETAKWINKMLARASRHLEKMYPNFMDISHEDHRNFFSSLSKYTDILTYLKPYRGDMNKKQPDGTGKLIKDITFYDEKEWRYVPKTYFISSRYSKSRMMVMPLFDGLDISSYSDIINEETKKDPERFTIKPSYKDIRYLFTTEADRNTLVNRIVSSSKLTNPAKYDLISKVITQEQIKNDF